MTYGLVLGGGGSRGSYELGVWKALNELNIEVSAIVGSSIGSINGALFIQGGFNLAKELWLNLDFYRCFIASEETLTHRDKLVIKDIPNLIKSAFQNKGIDITPFKNLLQDYLDEEKIRNSIIDFGIVTYSLSNFKPLEIFIESIPQGQLMDYLMASSCFPGFKQSEIQGEKFVDGGVYNNIPAEMLLEKNISSIITVNIHGPGKVKRFPKEKKNIIEIECSEDLGPLFHFEKDKLIRNIDIGYFDTLKKFQRIIGNYYYFHVEKIKDNSLLLPINDEELSLLLKSINYKAYSKKNLILSRVIAEISKYTQKIPDGNTTILTALEITAEVLHIERCKIYHYEELLDLILKTTLTHDSKSENIIKSNRNNKIINISVITFDLLINDENTINIRRSLAITSPKHFIASIFISLIKYRINKTSYN